MKLLTSSRILSVSYLLVLIALPVKNMAQEAPRPITPMSGPLDPREREMGAPTAIRAKLQRLRDEIKVKGLTFEVGYTAPLDFAIDQITGLVIPPNLPELKLQRARERAASPVRLLRAPTATAACSATAASFDWRQHQGATGIRDQGTCGSCWLFATHGAFESSTRIMSGIGADLNSSEQDTLDCSGAGDCEGGNWRDAFPYLMKAGSSTELAYPYEMRKKACRTDVARVFHAVDWDYVGTINPIPPVAEIKQALCEHGPLAVGVRVTEAFQAYTGGVFNEQSNDGTDHGVTLIGWSDQDQAWLIKNSWGLGWGETGGFGSEKGYMRIAYGSNRIGYAAAWVGASTAVEFETDTSWRAIGPLGNLQRTPLTSVGASWESAHPGWNSDPLFDDSAAAGWTNAIINATTEPLRPELPFIWVNDPNGDGERGSTPTYFRKKFELTQKPKHGRLTVEADDDAQVYVNGNLVLNDLSNNAELHFVDVTPYLKAGTNLIAVKAHDSFGVFEGLYLSLRVGAQESVNSSVRFAPDTASYNTFSNTAGCPASSVGKFLFFAHLSNLVAGSSLTDIYVEIAKLTNGNLLLSPGGLMGTGDAFAVQSGTYNGEIFVPFEICLANKNSFQFFVNVLAVK